MGYYCLVRGKYEKAQEFYNMALQNLKSNFNFFITNNSVSNCFSALLLCDEEVTSSDFCYGTKLEEV